MNDQALSGAISVASVAGVAGLLLPSIDNAWDAGRENGEMRKRLTSGEQVYFLILAAVGGLWSVKARSWFPLVFGLALGGAVAFTYERALSSQPGAC